MRHEKSIELREEQEQIAQIYQEIIDCDMQIQQLEYRELGGGNNSEENEWRIKNLQQRRNALHQELRWLET
ncbi:MAG: hypothetical protein ABIJ21_07335 [Nanoarchaeota archaeon]